MREVRILFTGVGRRIELINAFRQAALSLNINLKIYGADITHNAPALAFCDYARIVCGMREKEYIPQLVALCQEDSIDILIPTIDTDLLVISENVDKFKNTKVLISSPDKIAICRDTNFTASLFESCGCKAPKTYNDINKYDGGFPCFIKPKDGSSSINAFRANDFNELKLYSNIISNYIIQPFIDGQEYTVDVFCDFDSKPIFIIPRIRLQVRAGEVLKTEIQMDEKIIFETKQIIEKFNPVGPMTVQLIREKNTNDDYFIEINPRFGGGSPLSMKAGANSAKKLLELITGESSCNDNISHGAIFCRFDHSVRIDSSYNYGNIKGVIFDLDDTLYNEVDYIKSGFRSIEQYLNIQDVENKLWKYFESGKSAIDTLLLELNLEDQKEQCLHVYREHLPDIHLSNGVKDLILSLKEKGINVGIITDGRPSGQRNKIKALGLDMLVDDIIITDELGGVQFRKPCDVAFRIMQTKWCLPYENLVYIGDNVNKDFQAPRQLGMGSIYFKNKNGLYYTENENCDLDTCSDFNDVHKLLLS